MMSEQAHNRVGDPDVLTHHYVIVVVGSNAGQLACCCGLPRRPREPLADNRNGPGKTCGVQNSRIPLKNSPESRPDRLK